MKPNVLLWFILALLWVLPAAAQDIPAPDAARVRFVHLSADVANVDVYVGNEPAETDLTFGTISNYSAFTPGIYPFSVVETHERSGDVLVAPADIELLANHDYVYGIMGLAEEDTFQRLLIDETAQFDDTRAGLAHVLFLHAMSGTAPVDARIEGSDQRFASGLEFGGYEFHSVAAGEYPLVVSLASDTSNILLDQLNPVTLYPDRLYFIAAVNAADGGVDLLVSVTGTLTISQLVANGDDFNTLRAFIEAAGLTETLNNRSAAPVTVFAPTDESFTAAFDALGLEPGTLLDAPDLLNSILLYHISPQVVISADANLVDTIPTLQGGDIQLTLDGTTMLLNGGARVTQADILASNGVIHLIDGLLIPPAQ